MSGRRLEDYTWASEAMLAAELTPGGTVRQANAALERLAGGPLAGTAAAELIAPAQRDAFDRRLAGVTAEWRPTTFAVQAGRAGTAADRSIWLRRSDRSILLVAEPAVGEQERLTEKVLELNDELVGTHRVLLRQQEELRRTAERIRNLEAVTAAGLAGLRSDELLGEVVRIVAGAVGSERATLLLRDEDGDLVARATAGPDGVRVGELPLPPDAEVGAAIAAEGRPRLLGGSRSLAGAPLTVDGEVIGVLYVTSADPGRFGDDDLALLIPAAERAALAIGHARVVDRERRIAETLQRSLLPSRLAAVEGIELAARFTPGAGVEVGGDWYDSFLLPGGELAVVVGDVEGKGLSAATLMGELRAGLRAYALEGGDPMDTLRRLNRLAERGDRMATVVLAHVDVEAGEMRFASAGHLPPLMLSPGGRAHFLAGGMSPPLLAFREDVEVARAPLEPGARVVLYTDGLVERRWEPLDDSLEQLRRVAEAFPGGSPGALCDHLLAVMAPPGGGGARDDVAVLVLQRS